jgi:DNA-binding transcriptional LysR family regulator
MKNLKDINWNHLHCFYELAKVQSLKRTAEKLGVAPSTLSAQLKMLEEKFNQRLFKRSSKGLFLTNIGAALFEKTKRMFEEGSRILEQFSEDFVGGYPVTVGIVETISHDLAAEFTSQYWDLYTKYGTVNTLRQDGHQALVDNLRLGNIDWGISLKEPKKKDISFAEIGSFEVVFCCSEDLYDKFKNAEDILVNIPFFESTWDKVLNKAILKHLRENGVSPKEKIYSDHLDFVRKLCIRGRCVMYLPRNPLEDYKGLKTFHLNTPLKVSLYALWRKKDEGLIAISRLRELVQTKLSAVPKRYEDIDLQIEVSDISSEALEEDL